MHTFELTVVPVLCSLQWYVTGIVVFRRRAENVYRKVSYFDIEGVGNARFQVLLPEGYNFSITGIQ